MGYASAVAWVLFVVILVFTLVQWRLADTWVYYEGGEADERAEQSALRTAVPALRSAIRKAVAPSPALRRV